MRVGVPRETSPGEARVALVPDVVGRLDGIEVLVERGAGTAAGFDDEIAVGFCDASHAAAFDNLGSTAPRRHGEGARQLTSDDEALAGNEETRHGSVANQRLGSTDAVSVDELTRDGPARQEIGRRPQPRDIVVIDRNIQRAGAAEVDRHAAVGGSPLDELVEETKAADGKRQERRAFARFDVRRQHAGRRLRRAHACGPLIDYLHRGAPPRELVRDGASDDAGAHDDDVRGARGHG